MHLSFFLAILFWIQPSYQQFLFRMYVKMSACCIYVMLDDVYTFAVWIGRVLNINKQIKVEGK